jgi:hypothetical protein
VGYCHDEPIDMLSDWRPGVTKLRTPVLKLSCLAVASALALAGCHSKTASEFTHVRDVFCDGNAVSIIVGQERSVSGNDPTRHSGGYLISEHEDSWLVTWSLQDEAVKDAVDVFYLGKCEKEWSFQGDKLTKQAGHHSLSMLAAGQQGLVLLLEEHLKVLDRGVEQTPAAVIQPDEAIRWNEYLFTRSRRHVFAWLPEPAIYSIPDMQLVKKLDPTDSFQEFSKRYRWRENANALFTEDLAYLIAVPHNGAAESEIGFHHTKAFCYRIDRDEVSTVSLNGLGDALIGDAQPVDGQIHWLVRPMAGGDRWSIVDSDSRVIAEFSLPPTPANRSDDVFWDPTQELVWIVRSLQSPADLQSVTREVSVFKFNVKDGSHVQLRVPSAELVAP